MKKIIYSSPFVPAEWITAHGLQPSMIMPDTLQVKGKVSIRDTSGMCLYARAFVDTAVSEECDAVIVSTSCDQMRRASELIDIHIDLPVFVMNVPAAWESPTAHKIYRSELKRLSKFMNKIGGTSPSDAELTQVMHEYDEARSRLRDARSSLKPRRFSETIAMFNRNGPADLSIPDSESHIQGIPLALTGGPLPADYFHIFGLIEEAGGTIVLDGTESGERALVPPFDKRQVKEDPLAVLADAYFGSIPDVFQRPNSRLYQWLKQEMNERGVRGIIILRHLWCDMWHAEVQRMQEWANVPLLSLDTGDNAGNLGRTATRIQSFMEMLK
ncbi:2-hydroxyacyl-CoA dehydratase [Planctomycetota bacterium]